MVGKRLHVARTAAFALLLFGCSDADIVEFPAGLGIDAGNEATTGDQPDAVTRADSPTPETSVATDQVDSGFDASDATLPEVGVVHPPGKSDASSGPSTDDPTVKLLAPPDGATVCNPVEFFIDARYVHRVQLFADEYPLSNPWDPDSSQTLVYDFMGIGYPRVIRLVGFDTNEQPVASDFITITVID